MKDRIKPQRADERAVSGHPPAPRAARETWPDQAEDALRESESRYRHLVEHANDIIYRADKSGHFTYCNPTAARFMGYAPEELLGRLYLDLIHPDYCKAAKRFYVRQLRDETPNTYYEYPVVTREGSVIWLGQNVQLLFEQGQIIGIQAIARDITVRRNAEERLQQAYTELEKRVAERTMDLFTMNRALQREVAERQRIVERQRHLMEIAAAINASSALNDILRMVRDAIVNIGVFDRGAVYIYDPANDTLQGTWGTDRDGKCEDISYSVFPVSSESDETARRIVTGELAYAIDTDFVTTYEVSPNDEMRGVRAHATLPLRAGDQIFGLVFVDNLLRDAPITEEDIQGLLPFTTLAAVAVQNARLFQELRQTQEALSHAQKLRAVGELASGVSHNVNNILAVVMGYAELISLANGDLVEITRCAEIIARAAGEGAEIVRRMQQFARKESQQQTEVFDLAVITREVVEFTRPAWHNQPLGRGSKIEVVTDLPTPLWVEGVPSEMREVLVNLIKNGVEAMPDGGALTLRGRVEKGQVILEIADTGIGMDETARQRVFESFYTTKGPAKGLGLGLAVAWGIVDRHHGRLTVQSAPGQGATFRLSLPPAHQAVTGKPLPAAPTSLKGIRQLLVEDEDLVRGSAARMLEISGADVSAVSDAFQAQAWLNAHAAGCALIISDQGMAGMTGIELLDWTRERYPHIRRALLSGWGTNLLEEAHADAVELILTKPLTQAAMVSALFRLCSEKPSRIESPSR